jgi:hypothetical protein
MEKDENKNSIKDASYVIYEGSETSLSGGISGKSKYAYFYSYDGDLLEVVEHKLDLNMHKKLDPEAPKPKPVRWAIEHWPAVELWLGGPTKGVPSDRIAFYDKNGNIIENYLYDKETKIASVFPNKEFCMVFEKGAEELTSLNFPLDLSKICQDAQKKVAMRVFGTKKNNLGAVIASSNQHDDESDNK